MAEHLHTHTIERHCDVAVIGGSAAGLAAALQIARQRRSVIVIDAGEPRNAPAAHMHGVLGWDGHAPADLVHAGREEVRRYGGEVLPGRALDVTRDEDGRFRVALLGGHAVVARRVLLASGIVDELPDVEGVDRHWGDTAVHCPFCHGYEIRDQRVVQIVTYAMGLHPTPLLRSLTADLTLVLHDPGVESPELDRFRAAGIPVLTGPVARLVDDPDGRLVAVELADGSTLPADAVVVGPRFRPRAEALASLGVLPVDHASGLGQVVAVDDLGATSVPGVYAAGNVTDPSLQVLPAAAHGSRTGAMVCFSLANDDLDSAGLPSGNELDWDHRYSGEQLWSGNPNGTLVAEATPLRPGRALDVGAGEGGDAVWLAEHGWEVTANDVTRRALERIAAEAEHRGLAIELLHADANAPGAFRGTYDLVSAQYASIPRTADGRGVRNLLDAVAPGGSLIVVSHDLEPMRTPVDTTTTSRPFDPDAYVRVEDVASAVAGSPDWAVEVHEQRPRPHGAASTHHVDDLVLHLRRLA